jgi:DNA-directed RNA polymerase II subunit RPB1
MCVLLLRQAQGGWHCVALSDSHRPLTPVAQINANDSRAARAFKIKSRKTRFNHVHALARAKLMCEADHPRDGEEGGDAFPHQHHRHGHGGCGQRQPSFRKESLRLTMQFKALAKDANDEEGGAASHNFRSQPVAVEKVLALFKSISTQDLQLMGLSEDWARPEWMIITVLPVPPMAVRPSISMDGMGRGEDDLTHKLADIIKTNAALQRHEIEGAPAHIMEEFAQLMQFHVATYMDNDIAGIPQAMQKSGRPLKSIRARLKGKEGRLRGNLMGKRVDFSARTVITGA